MIGFLLAQLVYQESGAAPKPDVTVPKVSASLTSGAITNVAKVSITIDDASAVVTQVIVSGTIIATQKTKKFDIPLVEGINNFVLKSKDAVGNSAADFQLSNVTLDTNAPVISSSVTSNQTTNSIKATFTVNDASSIVTTEIVLNGKTLIPQQGKSFDLILVEGKNDIKLTSTDGAGNQSAKLSLKNVLLDTVPPEITSLNHTANSFTDIKTVSIQITESNTSLATDVIKDGKIFATYNKKSFQLPLSEGNNNYIVKSRDGVGNVSELDLRNIFLDSTAPVVNSSLISWDYTKNNAVHITISDSLDLVTTKIFKNGVLFRTETNKEFDLPLVEGLNSYLLRATDKFGNKAKYFYLKNITSDTIIPTLTSNVNSNAITNVLNVTITVNDASPVVTQIFKNGVQLQNQTAKSFNITLTQGLNNIVVKTTDAAQNQSSELRLNNILYDLLAPVISANVYSNAVVPSGKIQITIDDLLSATTEVNRNGIQLPVQTSKLFELTLLPGYNTFQIRSTDALGNRSYEFLLSNVYYKGDVVAPTISSSVQSGTITNVSKIQVTVVEDASVTNEIYRDGVLVETNSTKLFDLNLAEGLNNFVIKSVDQYNNRAADFAISSIILDTVAPNIASSVSSGETIVHDKVSITITDATSITTLVFKDGVLIKNESSNSFELTLSTGVNNFTIRSTDAASNTTEFALSNITLQSGDIAVPVISASRSSNDATTQNKFRVTISDESPVSTQVYKEGILIATNDTKEFELILDEGVNNFKLVSIDAAKNKAPDFEIINLILNTKIPTIETQIDKSNSMLYLQVLANDSLYSQRVEITRRYSGLQVIGVFNQSGESWLSLPLTQGVNEFEVRFYDWFGNASPATRYPLYFDSEPPQITSNMQSNSFTNEEVVRVTIFDYSPHVFAEMHIEGLVLVSQNGRNFDYPAREGNLDFLVRAFDADGNFSIVFFTNITVDRTKPVITSTLQNQYNVNSLPKFETILVETTEELSSLSINGVALVPVGPFTYSYTMQFDQPGSKIFTFTGKDLAGNETVIQQSVTVELDQIISPVIAANRNSNESTVLSNLHIVVSDETAVSTSVYRDGALISTTSEKEFDVPLVEGVNNLTINSINANSKTSTLEITNLVLNTKLPRIETVIDSQNPVMSFHALTEGSLYNQYFEISRDGSVISTGYFDPEGEARLKIGLNLGMNNFKVKFYDTSGNVSPSVPVDVLFDNVLPQIFADIDSNITNKESIHITVVDNDFTYAQLVMDGVIVGITDEKEWDIALPEGVLTFYVTAVDAYGNQVTLNFENLIVDRTKPIISTNLLTQYRYDSLPKTETIVVESDSALSLLSANGAELVPFGPFTYAYAVQFDQPGDKSFTFIAVDPAGNETVLQQSTMITVDQITGPVITANRASNDATVLSNLDVLVADEGDVSTDIYKDSVFVERTSQKEIHLVLTEGVNNFRFHATNSNNQSTDFELSNITLNTNVPQITSIVEEPNSYIVQTNHSGSLYLSTIEIRQNEVVKASAVPDSNGIGQVSIPKQSDMSNLEIVFYDSYGNASPRAPVNIVTDTNPPLITASVSSGVLTKNNKVQITVADDSNVRTQVFQDGNPILSVTDKSFELTLAEGLNSFVLRSEDAYHNFSTDFVISNITLDSISPIITTNLENIYDFSSFPGLKIINVSVAEPVQSLKVNGQELAVSGTLSYSYQVNFAQAGAKELTFTAVDLAGNEKILQKSTNAVLKQSTDQQAPIIASSISSGTTTTLNNIHITITDESSATTYVYQNRILLHVFSDSSFDIPLIEGSNSFTLRSIDSSGNISKDFVIYDVVLDSVTPPIVTDLRSQYIFNKLPNSVTIFVDVSEPVQSISINDIELFQTGWMRYQFTAEFREIGYHNFRFKIVDFAGNENVVQMSTNVLLNENVDVIPPQILTNVISNQETDNPYLEVEVLDQTWVETTVVDQYGQTLTYSENSFMVPFKKGPNSFNIESIDEYGNKSILTVSNIFFNPSNGLPHFYTNFPSDDYIVTSATTLRISTFGTSVNPYISIQNNGVSYSVAPLPWQGEFDVALIEGENTISGYLVDSLNNALPFFVFRSVIRDTIDPIVNSNIPANKFSNQSGFYFETFDANLYTTTLSIDGLDDISSYLTGFYVPLAEGIYPNVRVLASDSAGNKTALNFGDVTIDRTSPSFTTNLQSQYELNVLPHMETLTIQLSEPVQTLSINGNSLIQIGPQTYSYTLAFDEYGLKQFTTIAVDFAGNETVQQDYVNVVIDSTAPVIYSNEPPAFIVEDIFTINVSISDDQDVTTQVFIDGNPESTQLEKTFNVDVIFDPSKASETKSVKLLSVDTDGKKVEKYFAIIKNKNPLALQIVSPATGSIVESEEVYYHLIANKALQSATINGNPVNISGDQISINGILYQSLDGPFTANVMVTDIYGQIATVQLQADVKTSRVPAWDYKECPIEQ